MAPPTNERIANLQAQMAYDQQRLNIRATCLELALRARQTVTAADSMAPATAKPFSADDLIADAVKMEEYIFKSITPPGNPPSLLRVGGSDNAAFRNG